VRVILLENEADQAERIRSSLAVIRDVEVECISTEYQFTTKIEAFRAHPPALFILDVIVDWTEPGEDVDAPSIVLRDGPFAAGVRCFERLAADAHTKIVPVVFYTGCRRSDLEGLIEAPFEFLSKDYGDHRPLVKMVDRLLRQM
jgi:hypothetical protein